MDAFAVSVAKGAAGKLTLRQTLATALVFGLVEGSTPLIGWLFGSLAKHYVSAWDHWLAFVLLGGLGLRMIKEGLSGDESDLMPQEGAKTRWGLTVITAIATSIDSMVIGIGLAFMDVNIILAAAVIGLATAVMTTIGMTMGKKLGSMVGKRAEIFGGIVLIIIGTATLLSHLGE